MSIDVMMNDPTWPDWIVAISTTLGLAAASLGALAALKQLRLVEQQALAASRPNLVIDDLPRDFVDRVPMMTVPIANVGTMPADGISIRIRFYDPDGNPDGTPIDATVSEPLDPGQFIVRKFPVANGNMNDWDAVVELRYAGPDGRSFESRRRGSFRGARIGS